MHIVLKRSVVTGAMGSRYERYIFHMCTMKIVAKLILCSYANPIRVAPPVSSHEYLNASKFNPKSADFRCIF